MLDSQKLVGSEPVQWLHTYNCSYWFQIFEKSDNFSSYWFLKILKNDHNCSFSFNRTLITEIITQRIKIIIILCKLSSKFLVIKIPRHWEADISRNL